MLHVGLRGDGGAAAWGVGFLVCCFGLLLECLWGRGEGFCVRVSTACIRRVCGLCISVQMIAAQSLQSA